VIALIKYDKAWVELHYIWAIFSGLWQFFFAKNSGHLAVGSYYVFFCGSLQSKGLFALVQHNSVSNGPGAVSTIH
jgi:hypothetical protein